MKQDQVPLPLNHLTQNSFALYLGNESVVKSLENPAALPQFTYIWGDAFTGKSHLLAGMNDLLAASEYSHLMLDAEQLQYFDFTAVLPDGLSFVLLDDIDVLAGDREGELALFNLFNYCKSHACQLVVTALVHPKSSLWQLPDLVSRLNSGLVFALETLKGELALSRIKNIFEVNGMPLEEGVYKYLQAHHASTLPDLYQLFELVASESLKLKRKVTIPLIKKTIQESVS